VERLSESASVIFARLQMCIDDAFPHLMQPLLETLYPSASARRA
jgi:type VI protein secretion system component VasA